ncbi:MAG: TrkA family potassium uptake protein [Candidatus Omnitrophota bacterium]
MYVVIVGCGHVGSELAKLLAHEQHNVVVIDKEKNAFKNLGEAFNGLTLEGSGFDLDLLKQAGIEKADAFCAVTNIDNVNLISAQAAKKIFKVNKVICRVYDPDRARIYSTLGLDIMSGTLLFAAMIRDKITETRFTSYLIESKELAVMEIPLSQNYFGKQISAINIPYEFLVVAIKKIKGVFIPEPNTVLEKGDVLLAVIKTAALEEIKKKFKMPEAAL